MEGARTCPHGTIEGNVVTELAVACHRAGHGKVLQGRNREHLGTKGFTSSCDSHSKLKGNDFKPGNQDGFGGQSMAGELKEVNPYFLQGYDTLEKHVE